MNRIQHHLLVYVASIACISTAVAADNRRTATVEDIIGVQTEITEVSFASRYAFLHFRYRQDGAVDAQDGSSHGAISFEKVPLVFAADVGSTTDGARVTQLTPRTIDEIWKEKHGDRRTPTDRLRECLEAGKSIHQCNEEQKVPPKEPSAGAQPRDPRGKGKEPTAGSLEAGERAYDQGDYATAFRVWLPLAEQDNAQAQGNIGAMYENGRGGIPQDFQQAVQWYRRAADQGDANAQNNLGVKYERGWGVPQDFQQAYFWYILAATRREPGLDRDRAIHNRDSIIARLTPAQLTQAQQRARLWQPKPESPSSPLTAVPSGRPSPSPALPPSFTSDIISRMQVQLKAQGFDPGSPDGSMGSKTREALRGFQNARGLQVTGEIDKVTLEELGVR